MILAIYCCGGHGKEVQFLANRINEVESRWNEILFVDDNPNYFLIKNKVLTLEEIKAKYNSDECEFVIASGEPYVLKKLSNKVLDSNYRLTNLVAPDAIIDSVLQTGQGYIIQKQVVIACDVKIGRSSCVNFSSILHHDVSIGNYCFIASRSTICGNAVINNGTYVGAGSIIRDEIMIGSNCIIGMGSVVTKDVPDNSVVYGNPAKVIKSNSNQRVFQ
ncbi:MAG: acetyltransferase [Firmicutes bacterium]|nr:acetyltransferase [Bacillota bacterium]